MYKYKVDTTTGLIFRQNKKTKEVNLLYSYGGEWYYYDYGDTYFTSSILKPLHPLVVKSFEVMGYNKEYFIKDL